MADDQGQWPRGLGRAWERAADPTLPPGPPGDAVEAAIVGRLTRKLPHLGDPDLRPVQFAEVYARLLAVSMARAEFYGALLAEQYERASGGEDSDGSEYYPGPRGAVGALVGDVYDLDKRGDPVPVSEQIRALVKLEAEERDRAAKLARDGIRIGVQAKQVDVMRSYGHTVVAALRALVVEMGLDWNERPVREAAQRAIVTARTTLGVERSGG
ncbi:MAG: hypothetical protein HOY78_02675 [Saccharothrix sp.]|nr:hypothetical protein [Saccharothrix sp.]